MGASKKLIHVFMFTVIISYTMLMFLPFSYGAEGGVFEEKEKRDPIVLKMMIVNPSDKHKQTYPMKAYLPKEVHPKHILDKEDLSIAYDGEKGEYYLTKEVELDPGASVVKTVLLNDVWFIPGSDLKSLSEEAHELFHNLKGTKYQQQGELLLSNVEVLLIQIFESQNDESYTPEQHIAAYRENKEKMRDVQMDLMALRRFVVNAGGDPKSIFDKFSAGRGSGSSGMPGMITQWESDIELDQTRRGQVPAWVLWRIIFAVIFFVGLISLVFVGIWMKQVSVMKDREKELQKQHGRGGEEGDDMRDDNLKLGDFLTTPSDEEPEDDL